MPVFSMATPAIQWPIQDITDTDINPPFSAGSGSFDVADILTRYSAVVAGCL